jgi:hypothetical protein
MEDEFKRAFQTAGDQLMLITSILFDFESEFNAGQGFMFSQLCKTSGTR